MAKKYIDAEKLKAEIMALIEKYGSYIAEGVIQRCYKDGRLIGYKDVLNKIKKLQQEQPEVDLDKEMDSFFEKMPVQEHENIFEDTFQMIARHFYELGKNAK